MAGGSSYKIAVDLSPLLAANEAIAQAVFPMVSKAVQAVAENAAYRWKDSVYKAKLWQGEKTPYVDSIKWEMTSAFSAEISTDYKLASEIENGRPAKDLKRMLLTSKKTRQSKNGNKYLIIPFRHNIPTSGDGAHDQQMPPSVYALAKDLTPSVVLPRGSKNSGVRTSASGHLVPQHSYKWGGSLPEGLMPKKKESHKTDQYAGMVRFDTSTKNSKSSSYLTFRVMSETSSGWIIPAKQGLYLARNVAEQMQPLLEKAVGEAVTLKSLRIS